MKSATLIAIEAHAIESYPNECAGFIFDNDGVESYARIVNLAASKSEHVVLPKTAFADAIDTGALAAFVHSHPDAGATASDGDRVNCEESGVPWYIISVVKDSDQDAPTVRGIERIEPAGYVAPLVGRAFQFGTLDCFTLIRDWYARERGIRLPEFDYRDDFWKRGEEPYLTNFEKAGFYAVADATQAGDLLLMQVRSNVANHAGIYLADEHNRFLHHLYNQLSRRDVYGGYWREVTRKVLRYGG